MDLWATLAEERLATVRARGNLHRASEALVAKYAAVMSADDLDWSHGSGPEVVGPAAALGLTFCGRSAWTDRLSGPGRESLATWVG